MTYKRILLPFLGVGFLLLASGCQNEIGTPIPLGNLVSHTDCLLTQAGDIHADILIFECLSYQSQAGEVLLSHEGAVFNCMPGEISSTIRIFDNIIEIHEFQSQAGAHCICPYNLEYKLINLSLTRYHLKLTTYDNRLLEMDILTEVGTQDRVCLH